LKGISKKKRLNHLLLGNYNLDLIIDLARKRLIEILTKTIKNQELE